MEWTRQVVSIAVPGYRGSDDNIVFNATGCEANVFYGRSITFVLHVAVFQASVAAGVQAEHRYPIGQSITECIERLV